MGSLPLSLSLTGGNISVMVSPSLPCFSPSTNESCPGADQYGEKRDVEEGCRDGGTERTLKEYPRGYRTERDGEDIERIEK